MSAGVPGESGSNTPQHPAAAAQPAFAKPIWRPTPCECECAQTTAPLPQGKDGLLDGLAGAGAGGWGTKGALDPLTLRPLCSRQLNWLAGRSRVFGLWGQTLKQGRTPKPWDPCALQQAGTAPAPGRQRTLLRAAYRCTGRCTALHRTALCDRQVRCCTARSAAVPATHPKGGQIKCTPTAHGGGIQPLHRSQPACLSDK